MALRKNIQTDKAPAAIGPYSQAMQVGDTLYISGQLGIDPATGKLAEGGVVEQTKQALANIGAILTEANMTIENIIQMQVFLADIKDFAAVNEVGSTEFLRNSLLATFQIYPDDRVSTSHFATLNHIEPDTAHAPYGYRLSCIYFSDVDCGAEPRWHAAA